VKGNDPAYWRAICVEDLNRQQHSICGGISKTGRNRYGSKDNQGNPGGPFKTPYRWDLSARDLLNTTFVSESHLKTL